MMEFLKVPFLDIQFYYINDLPNNVICNIAICADDTTLYSLSVVRLLKSYLIYENGAGDALLISMLQKLNFIHLTWPV